MRRFENINGEKPVIEIKEHAIPGSQHIILTFKNGYGASIIPEYHYPQVDKDNVMESVKNRKIIPGLYELAVFHNGELCYETPITDDVLRRLNDPELQNAVEKIQRLEFMSIHHLHNEDTDA
tara:strand:- start:206 stop:571 length:366 start_codon:yes stop_codon:yes gene_type:complete